MLLTGQLAHSPATIFGAGPVIAERGQHFLGRYGVAKFLSQFHRQLGRVRPKLLARVTGRRSDLLLGRRLHSRHGALRLGLQPGVLPFLKGEGKVVPYLDVPIQHAHERILKAMGRRVDAKTATKQQK